MDHPNSSKHVYLSYVQSDEGYADKFRAILDGLNFQVSACRENKITQDVREQVESALTHCSVVVVLIGPNTRSSRWVDLEISLATEPRIGQPGAGLLGIILPEHEDFAKPYYGPDNVPLRLHDRIVWEYAIVRKWTVAPSMVEKWLTDVERRRYHFRSATNFSVLQTLREFPWNDDIDSPRPVLKALLEQE